MLTHEQYRADAQKFLKEHTTAVVATSFNDEPRASTVYFYVDDNFNFYFITKRNTSKYMNIEMNPHVAVVVGTGPEHITVQAYGKGQIVVDDDEKALVVNKVWDMLAREQVKIWPIEDIEKFKGRNKVVFKIQPEHVIFLNLDSTTHPDTISEKFVELLKNHE